MKIWTVDAFASQAYSGNPAAVTIVEEFFSDEECQKIAAEMNLSETAFIKPLGEDHFHIRWFTPTTEVKLCGHATLASAHILFQENMIKGNKISLDSLSGPLNVYKDEGGITLDFPLQKVNKELDISPLKDIFKINIIAAVKALDDVIIELENAKAVRTFKADPARINQVDCRGVIVTAKGDKQYDFISRFFCPRVGVNEDPVTGSAHCKLADYWQKKLNKQEFLAYQASQRGGELLLNVKGDRVNITGNAITIMQGNWLIK